LRLFIGPRLHVPGAKRPARSQENGEQNGEKPHPEFYACITGSSPPRTRRGNAWDLRHFRLESVRWGLVGHKASH